MSTEEVYRLGDIIKWKLNVSSEKYDYGMVIKEPEVVTHGTYTFSDQVAGILDCEVDTFRMENPLYSVTVFSFAQQKVVTLYRNPEDLPLFLEKVTFSKESP